MAQSGHSWDFVAPQWILDFSKQVPGSRRSESCGTTPTCFDPRTEDSHLEELQPQWLGYPKIIQNTMTDITVDDV